MNQRLQNIVRQTIKLYSDLANETFYGCALQEIYTSFALHLTLPEVAAASFEDHRIDVNMILLQENPEAFITEIIPHEVAHLVTHSLYHRPCGHGLEWKVVMRKFGKIPTVRHSFDTRKSVMFYQQTQILTKDAQLKMAA
jgi:predicted SprT family Zn-dependent metalloprotease